MMLVMVTATINFVLYDYIPLTTGDQKKSIAQHRNTTIITEWILE